MSWLEYQMLWPVQSRQALAHLYGDLLANSGVSNLGEELYGNDNKQCHGEFDKGTSAEMKNISNWIFPLQVVPLHHLSQNQDEP